MGKMNELSMIIDNLIACGETLAATGRALKDFYSQADEAAPTEKLKGKKAPNAEKKIESTRSGRTAVFKGRCPRHSRKESQ